MRLIISISLLLLCLWGIARAQFVQQQYVPLTEWRAQIDGDLARVPMTREAHSVVFTIMQAYERQAQAEKAAKHAPSAIAPEAK